MCDRDGWRVDGRQSRPDTVTATCVTSGQSEVGASDQVRHDPPLKLHWLRCSDPQPHPSPDRRFAPSLLGFVVGAKPQWGSREGQWRVAKLSPLHSNHTQTYLLCPGTHHCKVSISVFYQTAAGSWISFTPSASSAFSISAASRCVSQFLCCGKNPFAVWS